MIQRHPATDGAEQNDGAQNADSIVQAWRKLTSKRPDVARAMAELMHDATLAAYDPDVSQPNNTQQADIRKRWINLPDEAKQIYRQAQRCPMLSISRRSRTPCWPA